MNSSASNRNFLVAAVAALILSVLAGPFSTSLLPVATRALLWATLIALNALKWWAWYRFVVPRFGDGLRPAVLLASAGALLLNLSLPLEVAFVYRAVGLSVAIDWLSLYLVAVAISLVISAVVGFLSAGRADEHHPPSLPPVARGLAARPDAARLIAATAEDHYVRLHLEGGAAGSGPLVLCRFGDAVADLAALDGEQVHRGAWVAARGVIGAERVGRQWRLRLAGGMVVPVSERHLRAVRARGWLQD